MGFSHVVAAAVVVTAVSAATFHVVGRAFDAQDDLQRASREAERLAFAAAQTRIAILDVEAAGGTVTVTVENQGSVTLSASDVDLLLDGVAVAVTGRLVDGAASDVWAPMTTLELTASAAAPSSALAATGTGVTAVWRL